jgi:hypothetical protein
MLRLLNTVTSVLVYPILLANLVCAAVSGVWLLIVGEWFLLGIGVLSFAVANFAIGILLLPAIALTGIASSRRSARSGLALLLLGNTWTIVTIIAWCVGVLIFFATRSEPSHLVPAVLWSYGVATGPWSSLAAREMRAPGNEMAGFASGLLAMFAQVAHIAAMVITILGAADFRMVAAIFSAVMLVPWSIQIYLTGATEQELMAEVPEAPPPNDLLQWYVREPESLNEEGGNAAEAVDTDSTKTTRSSD